LRQPLDDRVPSKTGQERPRVELAFDRFLKQSFLGAEVAPSYDLT